MKAIGRFLIAIAICYFGVRVLADDAKPTKPAAAATADKAAASGESDKVDLNLLNDKYWAAKDSDFSVVQNRTYTKAGRWFLSASAGSLINDQFSTGRMYNIGAGYYFNERFGIEVDRENGNLTNGPTVSQLISGNGVTPNYNQFQNYTSVNVMWVPMYAKMSVMEKAIWYFDLQFSAGIGSLTYQNQITTLYGNGPTNRTTMGYNLDVTANVFFSKNWAFRLDMKNKFTTENLKQYNSGTSTVNDLGNQPQNDTTFLMGFTFFH